MQRQATFPQANDMNRVLIVLDHIGVNKGATTQDMVKNLGMNSRQVSYHTSALQWLGLTSKEGLTHKLTFEGRRVRQMKQENRVKYIALFCSQKSVFQKIALSKKITKTDLKRSKLDQFSDTTVERRLNTARSWNQHFSKSGINIAIA